MGELKLQLIETLFVVLGYFITIYLIRTIINNSLKHLHLQRSRRKILIKTMHLFTFLILILLLLGVWGMERKGIAVFVGTILTAFGIAFFAQWSLLSNITSALLLFFNHPMKIGDRIRIAEKDSQVEGEITDLTYFFIHVLTESGELITIPNSLAFQKTISVVTTKPNPVKLD